MIKQVLTTVLVISGLTAIAQSEFEGTLMMETTSARTNENASVTIHIKGSDTRMDFDSKTPDYTVQYSLIVDGSGADIVSQGKVTKLDPNKLEPARGTMLPVQKKGNVEIHGYDCTYYQFSDGKETIEYWMTESLGIDMDDLPTFLHRAMPKPEGDKWEGIPVSMIVKDNEGNTVSTQKLVSVNEGRVEDSVFERK
jgi:hypothetical protein